ncbi:MAG: menaquinone biosynthesis protein [Saprospiraceae bacterium]|nr:menaquinone biosynthesis protein [Saprospiraceae bacterium]
MARLYRLAGNFLLTAPAFKNMQKLRLTAVSYLNTKPFIYGLFRSPVADQIELSLDIPSVCAQKIADGRADLALAPVAILPQLQEAFLVSDYCIGAIGPVQTVCIFSEQPIERVSKVYLDFHSKTSATLAPVLCSNFWGVQPEFVQGQAGFEEKIRGDVAGLVIGDRAIALQHKFPFVYDFGAAWKAWTGLPFVFAAWVSPRPLPDTFLADFNEALRAGIDRLPELTQIIPSIPGFDMEAYFRQNISYDLDESKWQGLQHFLSMLPGGEQLVLHRQAASALPS